MSFLSQKASATQAGVEARTGKRHLGFLQLQKRWCRCFDGRARSDRGSDYAGTLIGRRMVQAAPLQKPTVTLVDPGPLRI